MNTLKVFNLNSLKLFFSNPKTGSESLREMLTPYSDILDIPFKETYNANTREVVKR